jgi:hypothetical protein
LPPFFGVTADGDELVVVELPAPQAETRPPVARRVPPATMPFIALRLEIGDVPKTPGWPLSRPESSTVLS